MLNFAQVAKSFKKQAVLGGVNLSIDKGERIALVGSNGAGKTTLIRCLLGEYTYQGEVSINGLAPRPNRSEVLAKIGFVPQIPPPLKMPVGELVEFAAQSCQADAGAMIGVIERLGLGFEGIKNLAFNKLSGGQKQKVLIGIALGRPCEVLILDEPAANLDPVARQIFFEILAGFPDETIMLITSHRLDEVAALVNRVIEMDFGQIILDDRVEDAVSLTSRLNCEIGVTRPDAAFAKAIKDWGFNSAEGISWQGEVAGPDRLRFLGMLSRYAGILKQIEMKEKA